MLATLGGAIQTTVLQPKLGSATAMLPAVAVAAIVVEVGVIEEIVRVIVIEVGAKKLNMVMRECQFVGNLLSQLKFGIRSAMETQA